MKLNNKGEISQVMTLGTGLIMLIVLGYIAFPIVSGVQSSISWGTVNENSSAPTRALYGSYNNYTNGVAGALTLFGVSPIIVAAVIALFVLMLLARKK